KKLSDGLTVTDQTISATKLAVKSLSDPLTVSDTVSKTPAKPLSDPLTISDNTVSKKPTKSLSDPLTISDQTVTKTPTKKLSDGLTVTDQAPITSASLTKSLQDNLTPVDTVSKSPTKSVSDDLNTQDSVTQAKNIAQNQQLIENSQTQVTVDASQPQLVITSNTAALSNIVVPPTVTNATIDYSAIASSGTVQIPATNWLNMTRNTNTNTQPAVSVSIPPSTKISGGTSWNNVLQLPTITSPPPNLSIPITTGQTTTTHTVLIVGSSVPLHFNTPVRMLLAGEAGLDVGFFYDPTNVTPIANTCTDDSSSGISTTEQECKIDVGSDLVIWTRHFTGFATWSSSSTSSAPS
ncbi:MAG: hypothetical protein KGL95_03065, partial [Patescibacteria group bacterium]|nr:hypothetical protein [Patescibacteria group bacterium]